MVNRARIVTDASRGSLYSAAEVEQSSGRSVLDIERRTVQEARWSSLMIATGHCEVEGNAGLTRPNAMVKICRGGEEGPW